MGTKFISVIDGLVPGAGKNNKIGWWQFLHFQLQQHFDQLYTVLSAMIKNMSNDRV